MTATVAPACLVIHEMESGGFVVRGTAAVDVAWDAVAALIRAVTRAKDPNISPWDLELLAPPPLRRSGLFRWIPCNPTSCPDGGEGHAVHLLDVDGPGQGAWPGVHFRG